MAKFRGKNVGDGVSQQANYALDLATLGGATKNRNDPISVSSPRVAKASTREPLLKGKYQYGAFPFS